MKQNIKRSQRLKCGFITLLIVLSMFGNGIAGLTSGIARTGDPLNIVGLSAESDGYGPEALIADRDGITDFQREAAIPAGDNFKYVFHGTGASDTGLAVTGSAGASFTYANTIDVSDITKNDQLISFAVDSINFESSITACRISLIDAYDESNQISLYFREYPYDTATNPRAHSYIQAEMPGFYGAVVDGIPKSSGMIIGWWVGFFQRGASLNNGNPRNLYPFNLSYDAKEKALYCRRSAADNTQILALTDNRLPTQWKGFTDGKVYLRVELVEGGGTINITSIGGKAMGGAGADMSPDEHMLLFKDNKELRAAGDVLHDGAKNLSYTFPEIIPLNRFKPVEITRQLFKGSASGGEDLSHLITDNSFIPAASGEYTVRFSADDALGNQINRDFAFTVIDGINPINFKLGVQTTRIGEYYKIPEVDISGGMGKIESKLYIEFDGVRTQVRAGDNYYVQQPGTLRLIVWAQDRVGQPTEKAYIVTLDCDVRQFIVSEVPRTLPVNQEVILPLATAYDWTLSAGSNSMPVTMQVTGSGGTVDIGQDRKYTPTVAGDAVLSYTAVGETKSFPIKIISAGENLYSYFTHTIKGNEPGTASHFAPDSFPGRGTASDVGIDFYSTQGNQIIKMPYPVSSDDFELTLSVMSGKRNSLTGLKITLTDYYDKDNVLELSIINILGNRTYRINGEQFPLAPDNSGVFLSGTYSNSSYATNRVDRNSVGTAIMTLLLRIITFCAVSKTASVRSSCSHRLRR